MSGNCSRSEFELRAWKREIDSACRSPCKWNCASGECSQWSGDVEIVEIRNYLRRTTFRNCYARVSSRASLKNIGRKVVELNFAICCHDIRARLAQVHLPQHTATDAQVCRRAIAARRFNDKHGFRKLDVFSLTIRELHRSRVDVGCGAFDSSITDGQTNTGDVEA